MAFFDITPLDPVEATVERIKRRSATALAQLAMSQNQSGTDVWANSYGLTPQQVFDGFGTDAVALCEAAEETMFFRYQVTGLQPNSPVPAGKGYVKNADGTVTVVDVTDDTSSSSSSVEVA